jgi:hypothetical protein
MAEIALILQDTPVTQINLGEIEVPERSSLGTGQPVLVEGRNEGDSTIRDVVVGLDGEGATNVQLAADDSGSPVAWAEAGQEIIAHSGNLKPGSAFSFWMQTRYTAGDLGHKEFELVFRAIDIG